MFSLKKQSSPLMLSKWESFDSVQNFYSRYGYVFFFLRNKNEKHSMLLNTTFLFLSLLAYY